MEGFVQYFSGFAGGLLIGGAATLLVVMRGRVAGIAGILGGVFGGPIKEIAWRAVFLTGLILGPFAVAALGGPVPPVELTVSLPLLVVAGALVGFGTLLGSGCTSGHGVCGLARAAPRSIAATGVFFFVAALTVFILRHVAGG